MANFCLLWQTLTLVVICELGVLTNQVAAQTFSVNPASSVDLTPGENEYGKLLCTFSKTSASDVIGWVVNGVRISNGNTKISSAIETALGPGADAKIQVVVVEYENSQNLDYEMDFFSVSEVLNGEYKCQLCTGTTEGTCGTVIAESTAAQVTVEYEPTTPLTCSPTTVTQITLGQPVTLYCSSDPGAPTVQLEWQRNSQVIPNQSPPVLMGGVLYHNYSFVPEVGDDEGVTYSCVRSGATSTSGKTCSVTTFILVSTPHVSVIPPSGGITPGSSGTYTCSATSDTNTPFTEYTWSIPEVDASRVSISVDGRSVTIDSITAADHEEIVQCVVTDALGMQGSGQYIILVEGEVVPSNLPTVPVIVPTDELLTSSTPLPTTPSSSFPLAAIIAIVVVGFILLCFVFGGIWFFQNKKKKGKHTLPTIVKNDLSPTSPSPYSKTYGYPNHDDVKHPDPDVIPKGPNERPVDVDDADWWRGSEAPNDQIPLKQVNIPVQSMGSNARLEDPYKYDPAYDDKADPAELDFKVPLDGGYGDGYDYGYPEDYSKKYNDMRYSEDGFDKQNYSDRVYGDGQQDSYPQGYGDGYNPADTSNYGNVYGDGYDAPAAPYDNGYDRYPDRMPDGSEGYEPPPPEEYNNQAYNGYNAPGDYGRPEDYSGVGDYNQPADYSGQPQDMGYGDAQPAGYDDRPADYDYQNPSAGAVPDGYNEGAYDDQYNAPYDAERIPDGGAPGDYESYNYPPEGEPYGDGYANEPAAYDGSYNNDQSAYNDGYGNDPAAYNDEVGYQPYPDQFDGAGQSQGGPYHDPAEEVSATSNPSYV